MMNNKEFVLAEPIQIGREDKFYYHISSACVRCGACAKVCPTGAISEKNSHYIIDPAKCIDCGTCSSVCRAGAAERIPYIRDSLRMEEINWENCYFNPGCAMSLYKPRLPEALLGLLRKRLGNVRMHKTCCRHDPQLPAGSTIINNCAGCDRRFRSLYEGIGTISLWEILDSIDELSLPVYEGLQVSVHDSCGYRHKPQVHKAIRNLLKKMKIEVSESKFSGTESICCGDNFYGYVPNEQVEKRIRMRASQLPSENVIVYCIGCVRAMESAGKKTYYLPDLILNRPTEVMSDTLDEYHSKLKGYIDGH